MDNHKKGITKFQEASNPVKILLHSSLDASEELFAMLRSIGKKPTCILKVYFEDNLSTLKMLEQKFSFSVSQTLCFK
ncbi:hypothetical protein BOTCAL_0045g00410 [Botryotinia calthae]|uniref:Uncharacterized protein n=1 Tax=Botryotinia calthae TaxID=38488 RepID=A0A4Y8DE78_9HELO|nr:hypothetical protein BOTCAL_0045g00410 [Botryotinia calthae]